MEERRLNEVESLELIATMIRNARTNQRARINCHILLVWGYTAVCVSIVIWALKYYHLFAYASLVWFVMPAICYPATLYLSSRENVPMKSYLDKSFEYTAFLFMAICILVGVVAIWYPSPVYYIEGLLFNTWIIIIGILIRYKPVIWGGIAGIVLSHILLFIPGEAWQVLIFGLTPIVSIILPGHLFKKAITQNVQVA